MVTVLGKLLPVMDFTNTFFFTRSKNYFSYNGGSDNHSSYNIWFLVRLIVQIVYHTNQSAIKQGRLLSRVSATCFITVNNERKAYIVWCQELIRQLNRWPVVHHPIGVVFEAPIFIFLLTSIQRANGRRDGMIYNGEQWEEGADVKDKAHTIKEKRESGWVVCGPEIWCGSFNSLHGSSQRSEEVWLFWRGFYRYMPVGDRRIKSLWGSFGKALDSRSFFAPSNNCPTLVQPSIRRIQ